ncbi:MAG: SDR family NAD(P)-dependent oxidoreductase [Pseudomonadota bacterium]
MTKFPETGARCLLVGATSAIVEHMGRQLAADGARLTLVARDEERLAAIAADLRARGAADVQVETIADLGAAADQSAALQKAADALGQFDLVVIGHGSLTDQPRALEDPDYAVAEVELNYVSYLSLALRAAPLISEGGALALISSVAGDRGRTSNFVYGSSKAGVSALAQGLDHALSKRGARALCLKPGFVDTPMTAHLEKGALWAQPEDVAGALLKAVKAGRGGAVYAPWFWRWIMLVIRALPRALFIRTKL